MTASQRRGVIVRDKLYIGGQWTVPSGSGMLDVINSTTEEVMGKVPDGTAADIDHAVNAARAALDLWSATPPEQRAAYLKALTEGLTNRRSEIAEVIAEEAGMLLPLATAVQAGLPVTIMGSFAKLLGEYSFEEKVGNSLIVREP